MCTRPLSKVSSLCNGRFTKVDFIPCGKCDECLLRKQAEFACLASLQSEKARSVDFLTLTYRPSALPVMKRPERSQEPGVFDDSVYAHFCVQDGKKASCCFDGKDDYCPSLRREDVRLEIKGARLAYKRKYGYYPTFVYAGFGEYG